MRYIGKFAIHLKLFRGRGKGVKLQTYTRSVSRFTIHLKHFIIKLIKLIINQLIMSNLNQT